MIVNVLHIASFIYILMNKLFKNLIECFNLNKYLYFAYLYHNIFKKNNIIFYLYEEKWIYWWFNKDNK